ncbi:maleylacetoacetate isomerase [Bradyrhizobium sp.]|uniref:maleylacetoacetate isomerase n=1 Tax=Bradyrhizobium sp. TaxID=376 RepID=UPI0025B7C314|nr:maleylacetoacetate isomerase [Bradyrhizobium sp.]
MNSIPRIALAPIIVLAFGIGDVSKIVTSWIVVVFLVFFNTFEGARSIDGGFINAARLLGASEWQITRTVVIPSTMAWVFASLSPAISFALIGVIVGEFIGAERGIGRLIIESEARGESLGHDGRGHRADVGRRGAFRPDPAIAGLSFALATAQYGRVGCGDEQRWAIAMGIQIYGFWRSIASFRVRVALKLKGMPFEEISVDILSGEQFKPDYEAVNAERVVPTFIHDGHSVFQSLAIIEYLEDIQQEPRLIPKDPRERAYARSLALMTVADAHPLVTPRVRNHLTKAFGADAHPIENWGKHWTTEGLAIYERILARRPPEPFALGVEPSLADICIAGQVIGAHFLKLELSAYPIVAGLADRCFALPAFATSHPFEQPGYKAANAGR